MSFEGVVIPLGDTSGSGTARRLTLRYIHFTSLAKIFAALKSSKAKCPSYSMPVSRCGCVVVSMQQRHGGHSVARHVLYKSHFRRSM